MISAWRPRSLKESSSAEQEMGDGEEGSSGVMEDELEEETQPRISCSDGIVERISQIYVKMEHFTLQVVIFPLSLGIHLS